MTTSKKRKAPSEAALPFSKGETTAKLSSPLKKIKRVEWGELDLFDPLTNIDFDFDNIDNL